MSVRVGSLCTGYGGIEAGIALAGLPHEAVFVTETEPAMATFLATRDHDVPNLGDITAVDWEHAPAVDVLSGGVPCQGWSLAGKRKGSDDERDLWPVRKTDPDGTPRRGALDAIRVLRPAVFVFENVANLTAAEGGQPWGQILGDLHQLRYAVAWTTVGACRVGACHHRHRVFLVATLADGVAVPAAEPMARFDGGRWVPHADVLFGDPGPVTWPQAGLILGGQVWAQPVDVCGADGVVLPTPTAVPYGNNQSPSAGAAVRPSLEAIVTKALPTPKASDTGTDGRRAGNGWRPPLSAVVLNDLLPTPTARDATRGAGWGDQPGRPLSEVIAMLPTPTTSDTQGPGGHGDGGSDLRTAVSLLPTPNARDGGDRGTPNPDTAHRRIHVEGRRNLEDAVALLPTPRAAADRTSRKAATAPWSRSAPSLEQALEIAAGVLPRELHSWDEAPASWLPTPRATDAAKGGPNQRGSSGDLMLPSAVQPGRFGAYERAVRRQEQAFGWPAPEPTEPGRAGRPRLAPQFPEWMQGLPPGWLTDVLDRRAAIKAAGNGVHPHQCAYALSLLATWHAGIAALAANTHGQVAA